jgi:hypothetical protein
VQVLEVFEDDGGVEDGIRAINEYGDLTPGIGLDELQGGFDAAAYRDFAAEGEVLFAQGDADFLCVGGDRVVKEEEVFS